MVAASIPRRVEVQYIKGRANVLADLVSRLKAVGLYHDINSNDHQQEFNTPFEPSPPVEPVTHMLLGVNETFSTPDIERTVQSYDTLHDSTIPQPGDDIKLSLENVSPTDILQLEENLMSLLELTPEKVIKLQKSDVFCKNILQFIGCSKYDNHFKDVMGILHEKKITLICKVLS